MQSKRYLTDVNEFRILSWEDYPESGWVQCNHSYPYRREAGESESESDIMVEAEIAVMRKGPQAKECR